VYTMYTRYTDRAWHGDVNSVHFTDGQVNGVHLGSWFPREPACTGRLAMGR
jgi:hypothetical protein